MGAWEMSFLVALFACYIGFMACSRSDVTDGGASEGASEGAEGGELRPPIRDCLSSSL